MAKKTYDYKGKTYSYDRKAYEESHNDGRPANWSPYGKVTPKSDNSAAKRGAPQSGDSYQKTAAAKAPDAFKSRISSTGASTPKKTGSSPSLDREGRRGNPQSGDKYQKEALSNYNMTYTKVNPPKKSPTSYLNGKTGW